MWRDVVEGGARWSCEAADCLEWLRALPSNAVDVLFCSPPYTAARTYSVGADRDTEEWVAWMRPVVAEACRVSKCLALFNVSDSVEDCVYGGGPELLFADATRLDGLAGVRPYIWHKTHPTDDEAPNNGQPGSGGRHFHRNCWEPIYGFADPAKLPPPWSDQCAFGAPPRYRTGGAVSMRVKNGSRTATGRMIKLGAAGQPAIANPGNVIRALVGGGRLGHPVAHRGEAPMPVAVAERFVCWYCPPDGIVADCFSGSGTTCHASVMHGRRFIGCDLRQSQVDLCARRLRTVTPNLVPA